MLVVVEGLDGAGKSTQVNKLKSYLTEKYGDLEYIHFPRYDSPLYGELIGKFLKGDFGPIETVHPQLVALLYAEDRHAASPEIIKSLASGKLVLLDRYVYSNIAYQCAKIKSEEERRDLAKWIKNTEYGLFNLPKPDINLFLDVPISFVEKKLSDNRLGEDRNYLHGAKDIHEADMNFQKRVREVYLQQCKEDDKFIRINCSSKEGEMLSPDDIFAKIKDSLDDLIG